MSNKYLYEKLEVIDQAGFLSPLPDYILENLSLTIELRDYQDKAFRYFISYVENDELRKNKQIHTLFHMATGSGKTVIMAGLIFYLYAQGYRNFLFFVNQTNILEKTKENFLNPASGKYLFAENPSMFGDAVSIQEVQNFSFSNPNGINLCFTTTQQLHMDLNLSKENGLTIEDFEDNKVVLISDESHHINTKTKLNKTEEEALTSWEQSVEYIFRANRDNILLEFTATADLKDPNVNKKYLDKIIFDYPLAKFRQSGYTKDFQNLQSDTDRWQRTLIAIVISEYRRSLFADATQNVKPVVLLKSRIVDDSKVFYEEFFNRLKVLTPSEIRNLSNLADDIYRSALAYFEEKDPSLNALVNSLQSGFAKENAIIINSKGDSSKEKQLYLNSLEDKDNPYRIIFTTDMLIEGWDVLNLFDIVRLYETRQGSGKAGKPGRYTIQEAQLIGRGARYCPFVAEEDQERYKRKYDYDLTNPNRILETMLYHSKQDSRYIAELKQALKATGLLPDNPLEVEYRLKDEFRNTDFFKYGLVFSNRKQSKSIADVNQMNLRIRYSDVRLRFGKTSGRRYGLLEDDGEVNAGASGEERVEVKRFVLLLKELPLNILYSASECFEGLKFNVLKSHYPNLSSVHEFLTSDNYAGGIRLEIESLEADLGANEYFLTAKKALSEVNSHILAIKQEYEGSREFYDKPIREVIRNKKIYLAEKEGEYGLGYAQSELQGSLAINLSKEDWYVYNDNYGTSEEKEFVKYFSYQIDELRKQYEEIYLVRNERIADFAIYSFDTGERFEPDFLLFLRKKHADGYEQEQIYIEPKGTHLLEKDAWKEAFLLRIEEEGIPCKKYVDDNRYKIIGLPFFNKENRLSEFEAAVASLNKDFNSGGL